MLLPFGHTLYLWRLHRGLTQQQLAHRARLPRPNLSAIERGKREVSLTTLRALALALDTTPGTLVDGRAPSPPGDTASFSRAALERIAHAVVSGRSLRTPMEQVLAELLRRSLRYRTRLTQRGGTSFRRGLRESRASWLRLHALYPPDVVRTLIQRIEERQRVHASPAN